MSNEDTSRKRGLTGIAPPASAGRNASEGTSIIIPVFGNGAHLARCLESLMGTKGRSLDILLVDDGSPEPVTDHLRFHGVRCHRLDGNRGPSHALNQGLERTAGEWVVMLNSDVWLLPESVDLLVRTLGEYPEYDFAVAKLVTASQPPTIDSTGDGILIGGGGYRIGHGEPLSQQAEGPRAVLSAAGTASVFRRAVLEEVGGFDESFYGFLEDLDLSLRAQLQGHRCLYVPSAVVYHQGGATFKGRGDSQIFRLITRNQIWVVVKNYPAGVLLPALPRILIFQALWFALMVWRGYLPAYLRGAWEAVRGLVPILRKRRQIQQSRQLTAGQFWELLRESEREIAAWQERLPKKQRSLLLAIYFGLFGWPTAQDSAR